MIQAGAEDHQVELMRREWGKLTTSNDALADKFISIDGYVKDEKKDTYKPCLFYRSGTQNLWRVAPSHVDGQIMEKGYQQSGRYIENSVNLPFLELAVPLNKMIKQNEFLSLPEETEKIKNGLLPNRSEKDVSEFQEQITKEPMSPFEVEE